MKTIKGRPASPGVANGCIRKIRSYKDYNRVREGEIIVTKLFPPEAVPVFWKIKGIITEEGSLLQHTSILAREFHIPCVVNVQNALDLFENHEKVVINGEKGEIERLKHTL